MSLLSLGLRLRLVGTLGLRVGVDHEGEDGRHVEGGPDDGDQEPLLGFRVCVVVRVASHALLPPHLRVAMYWTTSFIACSSVRIATCGRICAPSTSPVSPRWPSLNFLICASRYQSFASLSGGAFTASLPAPSMP